MRKKVSGKNSWKLMILFSNFRLSIWVVQKRIYFTSGRNTVSRKGSIGCILSIPPKMLKHFSLYKALSNTNKIILSITSSTFLSGDLLKFAKFQAFRHVFQTFYSRNQSCLQLKNAKPQHFHKQNSWLKIEASLFLMNM